ncbi:hypothetical protein [Paenibacillus donghaensis]|nr:hypothetical protein [Paenibacillus donghaensis]
MADVWNNVGLISFMIVVLYVLKKVFEHIDLQRAGRAEEEDDDVKGQS